MTDCVHKDRLLRLEEQAAALASKQVESNTLNAAELAAVKNTLAELKVVLTGSNGSNGVKGTVKALCWGVGFNIVINLLTVKDKIIQLVAEAL